MERTEITPNISIVIPVLNGAERIGGLLTASLVQRAAGLLEKRDAVVAPAEDGGYVLIGMREAAQPVFRDVDWSTEYVMAQTRERLRELGWQWDELGQLWDVDRFEDYLRLTRLLPEVGRLVLDEEPTT